MSSRRLTCVCLCCWAVTAAAQSNRRCVVSADLNGSQCLQLTQAVSVPILGEQGNPNATASSPPIRRSKRHRSRAETNDPDWTDVDATVPPVTQGVRCSLPDVLRSLGNRMKEFVTTLPQFTATERLEHQERDKAGKWRSPKTLVFNYWAELREIRPGMLSMEESRNGSKSPQLFPAKLADMGLPAEVLIFHPYFADEYSMMCEGLGQWRGQPTWQVHFQQRPDRPARLRAIVVDNRPFPERLKGRAWISVDTYQIVRLESDLVEPIPQVRLSREHLAIEYHPVQFSKQDLELWLPQSAEVYLTFRGRSLHRKHIFSSYLLFSVDVDQKIVGP